MNSGPSANRSLVEKLLRKNMRKPHFGMRAGSKKATPALVKGGPQIKGGRF
jgi:hypothetical protein